MRLFVLQIEHKKSHEFYIANNGEQRVNKVDECRQTNEHTSSDKLVQQERDRELVKEIEWLYPHFEWSFLCPRKSSR